MADSGASSPTSSGSAAGRNAPKAVRCASLAGFRARTLSGPLPWRGHEDGEATIGIVRHLRSGHWRPPASSRPPSAQPGMPDPNRLNTTDHVVIEQLAIGNAAEI